MGRHLKYFSYIDQHLIGCFAFSDAVLKLTARDHWIRWNQQQRYEKLEKTVLKLVDENEQLKERLYKLEVKANKDSSNSSKPPSSDSPYKKRYPSNNNKKNGKAGAKVGYQGHRQQLMEPTEVIPVYPDECDCGGKEFENQQSFYTHQEIELPETKSR